jgi:cytochrome b
MTELNDRASSSAETSTGSQTIKVWDLPIRIFHWSLVLLFIAAYVTNELGTTYFQYHVWCGYSLIVLVCFRIIWGLVGTYHARFIHFVRNPITTLKYALSTLRGTEKHYTGHNPLGAVMVIVLLLGLLAQGFTGLFTNDEILNVGPLYAYISNDLSLQLTSLHRQLFYWILGAVALHIVAVLVHQFIKRDDIITPMFTGKKVKANDALEQVSIKSSRIILALSILVVLALVLTWVIIQAPDTSFSMEEY